MISCSTGQTFLFTGLFLLLSVNTFHFHNSRLLSKVGGAVVPAHDKAEFYLKILPRCNRDQVKDGRWVPEIMQAPPYIPRTTHLRCLEPPYDYNTSSEPWSTYAWTPQDSACEFSRWNAIEFCELVSFATISIVGDSLSWEQYSSLLQLLGERVHQKDQHRSKHQYRNHVQEACRKHQRGQANSFSPSRTAKVVWRNDAQLSAEAVRNSIQNDFPLILVLNRGAHYRNDTELVSGMRSLLPVLSDWQRNCERLEFKCHLFWRTSVPGHPHCANFTSPENDIQAMETHVESRENYDSYDATSWNYHWYLFAHQNKLILRELEDYAAETNLTYHIIDAYEINIRRPDGHRIQSDDCLHNCYPGKMDVYNQILLHTLKSQRSMADVRHMQVQFERYRQRVSTATTRNATS